MYYFRQKQNYTKSIVRTCFIRISESHIIRNVHYYFLPIHIANIDVQKNTHLINTTFIEGSTNIWFKFSLKNVSVFPENAGV